MTIKSTGSLSITTDIVGEFGGSAPHSLSEYIRNGAYVPNATQNNGIPTSTSNISMSGFYGAVRGVYMTYEIIGAGGGGGSGYGSSTSGQAGGASTLTYTPAGGSPVTVTSAGGAGGAADYNTGMSRGESSYYGSGGAGGADSDSNNQTAGSSTSVYGAGGGGGGANPFSARNGGLGGYSGGTDGAAYLQYAWNSGFYITRYVGMPSTGTVLVVPGQTVTIVIGTGGAGGSSYTQGGRGGHGYCKLTIGGTNYTFTSTGTHTFTVP